MAAFDDRAMTYQALRDVARSQKRYWPDGRVNNVYPNGDGKRDIPDATEQYVDWVWQTYMTTGDRSQLASLYPVVKNISDYVARAIDPKTGLVTNLPGGGSDYLYGLVDWPPQMRYGYDMATAARTTENVLAVDVFRLVAAMGCGAAPAARPSAERSRRGPERLTNAMHAPSAAARRRARRRPRGQRHAEQARVADRERDRPGVRARAARRRSTRSPTTSCSLRNSIGVSTFGYLLTALHTRRP